MHYGHSTPNRWEAFKQLTLWELWLLVKASFLLPLTVLGLRWLLPQRVEEVLNYGLPPVTIGRGHEVVSKARQIAKIVRIATAWVPSGYNGLPRSMVLCRILQLEGIGCDLRMGACVENGRLYAHAWVEVDDVIVNDTEKIREFFTPLAKEAPWDWRDHSDPNRPKRWLRRRS